MLYILDKLNCVELRFGEGVVERTLWANTAGSRRFCSKDGGREAAEEHQCFYSPHIDDVGDIEEVKECCGVACGSYLEFEDATLSYAKIDDAWRPHGPPFSGVDLASAPEPYSDFEQPKTSEDLNYSQSFVPHK